MSVEGETSVQPTFKLKSPGPESRSSKSRGLSPCRSALALKLKKTAINSARSATLLLSALSILSSLSLPAVAQSLADAPNPAATASGTASSSTIPTLPDFVYVRPTQKTQLNNYIFDAFGPYPIAGSAIAAGINQFTNSPPEWHQGVEGYARRFGSDLGIVAVGTTVRYALSEALKEDTLYYRCECKGIFPRLRHAMLSTLMARRGDDGHQVFSIPDLIAPYAATTTAVYAWYPDRFGAKDAFRMGNYNMLAYMGGNVALEFFYSGPHSLLSRMHLNNPHGAPEPGPNNSTPDSGTKN
jgi:hypothetical protein